MNFNKMLTSLIASLRHRGINLGNTVGRRMLRALDSPGLRLCFFFLMNMVLKVFIHDNEVSKPMLARYLSPEYWKVYAVCVEH